MKTKRAFVGGKNKNGSGASFEVDLRVDVPLHDALAEVASERGFAKCVLIQMVEPEKGVELIQ